MKLLFVFLFVLGIAISYIQLLSLLRRYRWKKNRAHRFRRQMRNAHQWTRTLRIHRLCQSFISIAGFSFSSEMLLFTSLVFFIPGYLFGFWQFHSFPMGFAFGFITWSLPFLFLLFQFHRRQKEMASLMLPMLHLFLGIYTSNPNVRLCLQQATTLLPAILCREFQLLNNALHTGKGFEEALIQFGERVGNPIADDFADLLITAVEKGENITESLMNLAQRTQQAKFNNEMERTELIDIKYGTLVIIAITVFLIYYNIRLGESPFGQENTILTYYTRTSAGKSVILFVTFTQFISFIASLYIGRRKM